MGFLFFIRRTKTSYTGSEQTESFDCAGNRILNYLFTLPYFHSYVTIILLSTHDAEVKVMNYPHTPGNIDPHWLNFQPRECFNSVLFEISHLKRHAIKTIC